MSDPYSNVSDKTSVLGPTLVFKGELSAEEDLMLKGRVEGSIQHSASLRISKEGSVKGDIQATHLTVEGEVAGDLVGIESVTIRESADVTGNIDSPIISLIEGARFKGCIDMEQVENAADKAERQQQDTGEQSAPKTAPKVAAAGQ